MESTATDFHHTTSQAPPTGLLLLTNKRKSYPFSFAKKTAAFFKISRSINRLVRSLLWRIHSSPSATPGFEVPGNIRPRPITVFEGLNQLKRLTKVVVTQHQFDALGSLIFNIGTGVFSTSTLLKKLLVIFYFCAASGLSSVAFWHSLGCTIAS